MSALLVPSGRAGGFSYKFHCQGDFTISWEIRALIAREGIAAQSAAM